MTPDPLEPKNSGARAPARERARATPEPDPPRVPDRAAVHRWWWSSVLAEVQQIGSMHLPGTAPLWSRGDQLANLRGTAAVAARELLDRLANQYTEREMRGEKRMELLSSMNAQAMDELRPQAPASVTAA